jgi:hypothetical protein
MPLSPNSVDGIESEHIRIDTTDDGQVSLWVKGKYENLSPSDAIVLARVLLQTATNAEAEIARRQSVTDDVNGD